MGKLAVSALRLVLGTVIVGSLFVQVVMVPLLAIDLHVFGAVAAASLLTLGLGVALAPGDAVPTGVALLIGGTAVMVSGVALIVLVLRMLLAQAVAPATPRRTTSRPNLTR